ncbi:MAG: hypothetical protein RL563_2072 [Pseudomonadota bacterium]|jgi:diguanylate cyclase (GGDEF)-like protein
MPEQAIDLSVVAQKHFEAKPARNLKHYDISSALQTTLEFNELITIFANKIGDITHHSSVEYRNDAFDLAFRRGLVSRHSCNYSLNLEEESLGEIKLTRSQRFTKSELRTLESLLCCLVYPLRNASLFHQAQRMAYIDPLTKTSNKAAFEDTLFRETQRANRTQQPLSLIFVDVDHFKLINDNHGHQAGDQALTSVAKWIKNSIRSCDAVFRYGGEEFVVVLAETDCKTAAEIAERMRVHIESHTMAYGLETLNVTASLGVCTLRGDDNNQSLLRRADKAMYQAKQAGRNRVFIDWS